MTYAPQTKPRMLAAPGTYTRLSDDQQMKLDIDNILKATGPMVANHLRDKRPIETSFRKWLSAMVGEETFTNAMSEPSMYTSCYLAYMNLANAEATAVSVS